MTACVSNMRQIGAAMLMYVQDYMAPATRRRCPIRGPRSFKPKRAWPISDGGVPTDADACLHAYWNRVYLEGQINYIQTLYGDFEEHY